MGRRSLEVHRVERDVAHRCQIALVFSVDVDLALAVCPAAIWRSIWAPRAIQVPMCPTASFADQPSGKYPGTSAISGVMRSITA